MSVFGPKRRLVSAHEIANLTELLSILFRRQTMPTQRDVSNHYTQGNLTAAILSGIESLGKTINSVTVDELAPVDEFHIGGRQASEDFLGQLDLSPEKQVLDVGLGGAARQRRSRPRRRVRPAAVGSCPGAGRRAAARRERVRRTGSGRRSRRSGSGLPGCLRQSAGPAIGRTRAIR